MSSLKKQTRRQFLKQSASAIGTSLMAGPLLSETATDSADSKPNILYLLCDQWRGQALGCAGDTNARTPHIDKMAAHGIRLTRCYTNQPLCSPYRSMLMSGRYPSRTGVYHNNILLKPDEYCIGEAFADAGYATGYIGKWHLDGPAKPGMVRHTQGWQYFSGFNRSHHYYDGQAVYWEGTEEHRLGDDVYQPDDQTERAMKWITEQTKNNKPWFMMLSWGPPHTPYREIPQKYLDMFDPDELELRPNVKTNNFWDEKTLRQKLQGYYAQCKALDDNTGRIMKFLKDNGLEENTIVVITADHGDQLLSQGQRYKGKPWEESINVPFIAKWPGRIQASQTSDKLFGGIDIYPTLCGLAGIDVPPGKDGNDYSHILLDRPGPYKESVYLTYTITVPDQPDPSWRGLRTSRYTYAWSDDSGKPWMLYDNQKDPYQMNNLVSEPSAKEIKREMHAKLVDVLEQISDPLRDKAAATEL